MNAKRVLKCLISLLLIGAMLLLSSCSLITQAILKNKGYYTEYGLRGECADQYSPEHEKEALRLIEEMELLVLKNDPKKGTELTSLYERAEDTVYVIMDHSNLVYVEFCLDPQNEALFEEHTRLSGLVTDTIAKIYALYGKIYESALSESFYADWEEEDLKEALELSKTYTGAFAKLKKERDELVASYEQLDRNSSSFLKESAKYYEAIVSKNKELAALAGAESYSAYADASIYDRDFDGEQIDAFSSYVSKYLVPLARELLESLMTPSIFTLQNEMSMLTGYDLSFNLMKEKLTPYYEELGEEYSSAFSEFTSSVYTSKSSSSSPVAFTAYQDGANKAICYFGPGYQNLSTYTHELGHYIAFSFSKCAISSVDLCEVHSQGNEWLYLSYSRQFYKAEFYEKLTSYYLLNQMATMILACCCDLFERTVYQEENLTSEDYDDVFLQCIKDLGAYDFLKSYLGNDLTSYWHHAIVSNSMYYLSYAVSLIPALELFLIAESSGLSKASAVYKKLSTVESDAAFLNTVVSATLRSPFEEEIFAEIYHHFSTSR